MGLVRVLHALGPDLTAAEWSVRLGEPVEVVRAAARLAGVRLRNPNTRAWPRVSVRVCSDVLAVVRDHGPVAPSRIAQRLGRRPAHVQEAVRLMVTQGWVARTAGGRVRYLGGAS